MKWPEGTTVREAADATLEARGLTGEYDSALPQTWVDSVRQHYGFDVRGHFVWFYGKGDGCCGRPLAITDEGIRAAELAIA